MRHLPRYKQDQCSKWEELCEVRTRIYDAHYDGYAKK